MKLVSYFVVYSVLWSCLVCVPVLCPESHWLLFYSSKYQALAAAPKTWLSDWTGFTTAQSIKLWLLLPRPGYLTGLGSLQLKVSSSGCSSYCLISSDLIDWCCSISFVLQPSFVQAWLWPSSCSPADCLFLLFGLSLALLTPVLSINITLLIILHLGLSLVNWCDKTLTILDKVYFTSSNSFFYGFSLCKLIVQ